MNEYKIIFFLLLILFIYLKLKNIENFNIKVYETIDINSDFNKYQDWIKSENKLKTFKQGFTQLSDFYSEIITNYKSDLNIDKFINSELINQLAKINLSDNGIKLADFVIYTQPSAKLEINIPISEKEYDTGGGLYIKYQIEKKSGDEYKELDSNFTHYKDYIPRNRKNIENMLKKFLNGKSNEIGFERQINLDGKDVFTDKNLVMNRQFYFYEGFYKITLHFIGKEKFLKDIQNKLEIKLEKNNMLNESITSDNIFKSNKQIEDFNNFEVYKDHIPKIYLKYKLDKLTDRLKLDINEEQELFPNEIQTKIGKIVLTDGKNKFYYSKLVLVVLFYLLNKYNNLLNGEKVETFLDSDYNYLNLFEDNIFTDNRAELSKPGQLSLEKQKVLKKSRREIINENDIKMREEKFDEILSKYKNNYYNKYPDLKFKEQDGSQKDNTEISESLYNLLNKFIKEEKTNIEGLKKFSYSLEFEYVFDDYKKVEEEKEKLYPLLDNLTPTQYTINIVESIKADLVQNFSKNKNYSIELQQKTIDYLKHLKKYTNIYNTELKKEVSEFDLEELELISRIKDIILDLIEQINFEELNLTEDDAKLNTIIELINLSMKDYKFDKFIKIDTIKNNPSFYDLPSEIENFENQEKKSLFLTESSLHRKELLSKLNKMRNESKEKRNRKIPKIKLFKKKNNVSDSIEEFENMDLHKHTSSGQIRFNKNLDIDNNAWYSKPENKSLVTDFSYVDQDNKDHILGSLDSIERNIMESNEIVQSLVNSYAEFIPGSLSNQVNASIEVAENDLNKTVSDADKLRYQNKEIQQEERIKGINQSINELENIQNKIYTDNNDKFKSIKSYGDGQVLSIDNLDNNKYNIQVNEGCLEYDKMLGVSVKKCSSSKNQTFMMNNIQNVEKHNEILEKDKKPLVSQYSDIKYPFQIMNPLIDNNSCLTLDGNSVGVNECNYSNSQRWEALKQSRNCEENINI